MNPWLVWKDSLGVNLVDLGALFIGGTRVLPDGSTELSKKELVGYTILQMGDMEEAKSLLNNHPHLV